MDRLHVRPSDLQLASAKRLQNDGRCGLEINVFHFSRRQDHHVMIASKNPPGIDVFPDQCHQQIGSVNHIPRQNNGLGLQKVA